VTHDQAVGTLATERYVLGEMSGEDRQAFEEHFFACDICADDLRVAAALIHGAKAGFAATTAPAPVLPIHPRSPARTAAWYRSAALPWAAAAALAVVTTYQSFWTVRSPGRDATPIALVPVTLRPASRGAEAVVPVSPGTALVSLAIEINEPADSGHVAYTLRTADGRPAVSGRAAAPAPGTPLLLLIPSMTLAGSMHYVLSVRDAGSSSRLLGEYRFEVSPK
jgi:hypothetical protein